MIKNSDKQVLRLPRQKQSETVSYYYKTDEPPRPCDGVMFGVDMGGIDQTVTYKLYMDGDKLVISLLSAEDIYKKE